MTVENYSGKDAFKKGEGTPKPELKGYARPNDNDKALGISGGIGGWLSLFDKRLSKITSSLEDLVCLAKWAGDKDEPPVTPETIWTSPDYEPGRAALVSRLCRLRKDWTVADYHEAYDDCLDLPSDIQGCRDMCRDYIYNNYDFGYLEEVIENEESGKEFRGDVNPPTLHASPKDKGMSRTKMSAFVTTSHGADIHMIATTEDPNTKEVIVFEYDTQREIDRELYTAQSYEDAINWINEHYSAAGYDAYYSYNKKEDK